MIGEVLTGNNLYLLREIPDNSITAVVTDAPYGLGDQPDANLVLKDWLRKGYHAVSKKGGFMGAKWDRFVPQPLFWSQVYRVLKPGGFVLCFFGSRTYDWGVMAMRLAGFEILDQLQWIYGQGFPKSMNVSKAIDKDAGAEREKFINPLAKKQTSQTNTTSYGDRKAVVYIEPNAVTDDAKEWAGWGTALKPAHEPIVLARKPLDGRIIDTVRKWRTAAINIDKGRIPFADDKDLKSATFGRGTNIMGGNFVGAKHGTGEINIPANPAGRWPANVIMDEQAGRVLDGQSGILKNGGQNYPGQKNNRVYGEYQGRSLTSFAGDSGGASRFFYCPKATQAERNEGLEALEAKVFGRGTQVQAEIKRGNTEYREGLGGYGKTQEVKNAHETVKPIALMRYLVKLVAPKGAVILDPFAGSGTTGCACELEGVQYILMEQDERHAEVSRIRCRHWNTVYMEQKSNQLKLFDT